MQGAAADAPLQSYNQAQVAVNVQAAAPVCRIVVQHARDRQHDRDDFDTRAHSGSVFIGGDAKCDSNEDGVENDSTLKCDRGSGVPQTLQLSLLGVIRDIQGR